MATGGADYSAARIAPHEGRRSACREAQRTKLTGCERTARKRRRRAVRLSEWLGIRSCDLKQAAHKHSADAPLSTLRLKPQHFGNNDFLRVAANVPTRQPAHFREIELVEIARA